MPATQFLPSLSYPGSSGYITGQPSGASGAGGTSRYGGGLLGGGYQDSLATGDVGTDYAVFDAATGLYRSARTGRAFTGRDPNSGKQFKNGREDLAASDMQRVPGTNNYINPNDVSQRYGGAVVARPEQAETAKQNAAFQTELESNLKSTMKDFNDYLANAKLEINSGVTAANKAADITPTVNALTQAQQQYVGQLGASNQAYQQALANQQTNELGVYNLAEQRRLTDLAAQFAKDRQAAQAQVTRGVSRWGAGKNAQSGGDMGLGSDVASILAQKSYEASLPYGMAEAQQGLTNITNYLMPAQQRISNANINYAGSYLPGIAGAQYQSATGLAGAVQSLRDAAANGYWNTVSQLLKIPQVTSQISQEELARYQQMLAQSGQIIGMTNYTGLQDRLGATLSQPVASNMQMLAGSVPSGNPYYQPRYATPVAAATTGSTPTGTQTGAQDIVVNSGLRYRYDPTTGRYVTTDQTPSLGWAGGNAANPRNQAIDANPVPGYVYDSMLGQYVPSGNASPAALSAAYSDIPADVGYALGIPNYG